MPAIFPASTKGGGQCFAMPDVCLTPAAPSPIPIPYPNIGMPNQAQKTSTKVKIVSKETVTKKSEISRSSGDEAGTNKGVMSGTNMDKVTWKMGTSKVKIEGQHIIRLTSMTGQNGMSANMPAGAQIAPSQTKVKVSP
jgi:hypothetical protein